MTRFLSSSHKLHNLQLVSISQLGLLPAVSVDNLPVEFDRNPIRFHSEFLDERAQRFRSKQALVAVND